MFPSSATFRTVNFLGKLGFSGYLLYEMRKKLEMFPHKNSNFRGKVLGRKKVGGFLWMLSLLLFHPSEFSLKSTSALPLGCYMRSVQFGFIRKVFLKK